MNSSGNDYIERSRRWYRQKSDDRIRVCAMLLARGQSIQSFLDFRAGITETVPDFVACAMVGDRIRTCNLRLRAGGPSLEFPVHSANNFHGIIEAVPAIAPLAEVRPILAGFPNRSCASMSVDAHLRGAHYGAEVPPAVPAGLPRTCTVCTEHGTNTGTSAG